MAISNGVAANTGRLEPCANLGHGVMSGLAGNTGHRCALALGNCDEIVVPRNVERRFGRRAEQKRV